MANSAFSFTGVSAAGTIVQVVSTTLTTVFTASSSSYTNVTGLSVSITPSSNSHKILVLYNVNAVGAAGNDPVMIQILRAATPIAIGASAGSRTQCTTCSFGLTSSFEVGMSCLAGSFLDSPATTSSVTYQIQAVNVGASTITVNASFADVNSSDYPRGVSTITVMEVVA